MCLCDLSPEEILFLEVVVSIALIDGRSAEELNVLGGVLATVSSIVLAQAAVLVCPQKGNETQEQEVIRTEDLLQTIAALEVRLAEIEKKLG